LDSQIEDLVPNVEDLGSNVQVVNPQIQPRNAKTLQFANKEPVFGKKHADTIPQDGL